MKNEQFERLLRQKLDALPEAIQPSRNLWPGIDLAIENTLLPKRAHLRRLGLAASIVAVTIAALFSFNITENSPAKNNEMEQIAANISRQYEQQKQILLSNYAQQPALTDNWQAQLQELDAAADLIKTALANDPADRNLIRLLQQVYQQQIKLIQSVHQPQWL